MGLTAEQKQLIERVANSLNGGANMPTNESGVKGVSYVRENDIETILGDIAGGGMLMYNKAYNELKAKLRETGLKNNVLETDQETGYYNVSEWRKPGESAAVKVTYRVPMYTNSRGKEVRGKKLEISA